jgi:hypothetical protein
LSLFSPVQPGKPELGIALTYRGGDSCLKRVVSRAAPSNNNAIAAGGSRLSDQQQQQLPPSTTSSTGLFESWVPTPRQLTLRLRCDPSDASGDMVDPAAAMQLSRRVRVFETEMCNYVVEWPTRYGCPGLPHGAALRGAAAGGGGGGGGGGGDDRLGAAALFSGSGGGGGGAAVVPAPRYPHPSELRRMAAGALAALAVAVQAARQRRLLRILARGLRSGERHAWRQAAAAMLSRAQWAPPVKAPSAPRMSRVSYTKTRAPDCDGCSRVGACVRVCCCATCSDVCVAAC